MSSILKISEAAILALHSMAFLATNSGKPFSTRKIALELRASEAHLSKVLQRLAKVGLVKSLRGPKGGFMLGKACDKISLLDVYESIDGPFVPGKCLLDTPIHDTKDCILGGLLEKLDKQVRGYMVETKLSKLTCWGVPVKSQNNEQ